MGNPNLKSEQSSEALQDGLIRATVLPKTIRNSCREKRARCWQRFKNEHNTDLPQTVRTDEMDCSTCSLAHPSIQRKRCAVSIHSIEPCVVRIAESGWSSANLFGSSHRFLRWSQMVLTRVKWPNVVLMTAVGAPSARTGTVGGAEQRCGQGCGLPWPQWRRSGWLRKEWRSPP